MGCEERMDPHDNNTGKGNVEVLTDRGDSFNIQEYEKDIKFLAKKQAKLLTYPVPREILHTAFQGISMIDPDRHVNMEEYLDSLSHRDTTTEVQNIISDMDSVCVVSMKIW